MTASFLAYKQACDLFQTTMGWAGICILCKEPTLEIRPFTDGSFDVICTSGCRSREIDNAVLRVASNGVNGHELEERPPPPEPPPEPKTERALIFPLISFDELCDLPPPQYQVDNFFLEETFVQAYGETNHGKSLFIWDLACNICSESEYWFGRKIRKYGPVVWINADGGRGLTLRAKAWAEANGKNFKHPLLILMGSVQLNDARQVNAFRRQLMAMDPRPVLVVFDTQSRCMPGGDENDQGTMTRVTEGLHRLKMDLGCTVLTIHHTDKTGQWERGSGVVKNETDAQIRVSKDKESGIFTVSCRKLRDGEEFRDFYFTLMPVGDSVVITQSETAPPRNKTVEKLDRQHELTQMVIEKPGITCEEVADKLEVSVRTVERDAEKLEEMGVILRRALPKPEGERGVAKMGLFPNPGVPDPRIHDS